MTGGILTTRNATVTDLVAVLQASTPRRWTSSRPPTTSSPTTATCA